MREEVKSQGKRRSNRQRIDLSSEEGFDRHELERALRQSLEEERLREKESPKKKISLKRKVVGKQRVPTRRRKDNKSEESDQNLEENTVKQTRSKRVEVKPVEEKEKTKQEARKHSEEIIEVTKKSCATKTTVRETKHRRLPKANDLITLLACAKQVLGGEH